jgi:hypothetical protein
MNTSAHTKELNSENGAEGIDLPFQEMKIAGAYSNSSMFVGGNKSSQQPVSSERELCRTIQIADAIPPLLSLSLRQQEMITCDCQLAHVK